MNDYKNSYMLMHALLMFLCTIYTFVYPNNVDFIHSHFLFKFFTFPANSEGLLLLEVHIFTALTIRCDDESAVYDSI